MKIRKLILLFNIVTITATSSLILLSCSSTNDSKNKIKIINVEKQIFIQVAEKDKQELVARNESTILKYFSVEEGNINDYIKLIDATIERPTLEKTGLLKIKVVDVDNNEIVNNVTISKINKLINPIEFPSEISIDTGRIDAQKLEARVKETILKYFLISGSNEEINTIIESIRFINVEIIEPTTIQRGNLVIEIIDIDGNTISNNIIIQKLEIVAPTNPTLEEFQKAGKKGNLDINSYADLIKNIESINDSTIISELTNEILQTSLNGMENYKDLVLSIENKSSEAEGKLILNLNGMFENNQINNKKIIITGFRDISNYNILENFVINSDTYISNLLTNEKIKELSVDRIFNEYLMLFITKKLHNDNTLDVVNIIEYKAKGVLVNFHFTNMNSINQPIQLSFDWQTKKYNSTTKTWENELLKKIVVNDIKISIGDRQIISYLVKSSTINNRYNRSIYGSNLYSRWQRGLNDVENYIILNEEVKNHYFGEGYINLETYNITVNDYDGEIEWTSYIKINEGSLAGNNSFSITKNFTGFKKISELPVQPEMNFILINPLEPNNSFFKSILSDLKPLKNNLELNNEKFFTIDRFKRSFDRLDGGASLYRGADDLNTLSDLQLSGVKFYGDFFWENSKTLFDQISKDRSGLLGGIYIESIWSSFKDQKIAITKTSETTFRLNSKLTISYQYLSPTNEPLERELSIILDGSFE